MAEPEDERGAHEDVEPLFAGLRGAHGAGSERAEAADAEADAADDAGPAPDPWHRGSRAHDAVPAASATDEDRPTAGMFVKALVLTAFLVAFSAAVYFVFGV